jgi:hypothetical protein
MVVPTKSCSGCKKVLRRGHHHTSQWNKKTEQATCKQCLTHLECSACHTRLSKECYNAREWSQKPDNTCTACNSTRRVKPKLPLGRRKEHAIDIAEEAPVGKVQEEIQPVKATEEAPVRVLDEATPAVNETTNEVGLLLTSLGFKENDLNALGDPAPRKPPPPSILSSRACS